MALTRRSFGALSALTVAGRLVPRALAAQQPAAPPAPAVFTPLRRNVGIFHQRGGTIGWLANDAGVVVIDTQFADTAPNFLTGLKERTPRPIDVVINTHHHPDHTGGNAVLRAAAKQLVAHQRSSENQKTVAAPGKTQATLPDVTFTDVYGHAEAGHPFIGTRADLHFQRDYFSAVVDAAHRARRDGRSREELVKTESLRGFEDFGGTKSRLGLALGIAYDELTRKS